MTQHFAQIGLARDEIIAPNVEEQRTQRSRLPFLARLTGRDTKVLACCPSDEIRASTALGTALLVASAVHGVSMTAALSILNVPLFVAVAVACVTATGLFAVDRIVIRARDVAMAEVSIRRIDAAGTPMLSSSWSRLVGRVLRILFSATTAIVLAGAISLHFFQADIRAVIVHKQTEIDAPFITKAETQLSAERAVIDMQLQLAEATLTDLNRETSAAVSARTARTNELEAEVKRLQSEMEALRQLARAARAEAARQRNIARCELRENAPDCDEASGRAGPGMLHSLANERAAEADAQARTVDASMATVAEELGHATAALDQARREAVPVATAARDKAEEQMRSAADAIAAFEASMMSRAAEMVAQNPERRVLDPTSLAERLSALAELAEDKAFLAAMIGIKALALAIELLAIISASLLVPTEYALRRGYRLSNLARELQNRHFRQDLEDAQLRAEVQKARRQEADETLADVVLAKAMKSGLAGATGVH